MEDHSLLNTSIGSVKFTTFMNELILSSHRVVPAVNHSLSFICFSNDKLGSGPYWAIIHRYPVAHDLVTSRKMTTALV